MKLEINDEKDFNELCGKCTYSYNPQRRKKSKIVLFECKNNNNTLLLTSTDIKLICRTFELKED